MNETMNPRPHAIVVVGTIATVMSSAIAGAYFVWMVMSHNSDIDHANYVERKEYVSDNRRIDETTKRLDNRLDDLQRSIAGLDMMKAQIADLWAKYYREVPMPSIVGPQTKR